MSKGKLRVEQIGSAIGRKDYQFLCLKGLGLGKLHRVKEVEDTPSTRGLIRRVSHLVKVEEV